MGQKLKIGQFWTIWYLSNKELEEKLFLLSDYELIGQDQTGLDVIEKLQLQKRSVLVTSYFDEINIRDRCIRLGIQLLPKELSCFIPISVCGAAESLDAVLIDDDDLVRRSWENSARKKEVRFRAFSHPLDFFQLAGSLDLNTNIYVDASLGEGIQGDAVSEQISKMGFTQIYLATSFNADYFSSLPFLKGIQGKRPPWEKATAKIP